MDAPDSPTFVPVISALAKLGIKRTAAYRLLNSGAIPAKKLLGKTVIRTDDLAAFERDLPAYTPKRGRPRKARSESLASVDFKALASGPREAVRLDAE